MLKYALFYLVVTLLSLTALPIFSDEAIYMRWSQVAMREPAQYAFLPMLDGKPPLHSWLLAPFLSVLPNPLFAGRLLSVLLGLGTVMVLPRIVRLLGGDRRTERLLMLLATITPFFYVYNRMALAEALVVFLFSVCIYAGLQICISRRWRFVMLFAAAFGAALWTKTTTLFFVPVFALIPLLILSLRKQPINAKRVVTAYLSHDTRKLVLAGVLGGVVFSALAFSPLFPSLFNRSVDYTFSIRELADGGWRYVLFTSLPRTFIWIVWYLTPFLVLLAARNTLRNKVLGLMALVYIVPLVALGKVISARYFLPAAVPALLMAVLGVQDLLVSRKRLAKLLVGGAILSSALFIGISVLSPDSTPYAREDRVQYLTDWSSGHGIIESVVFLSGRAASQSHITVATEGYFGTLPDALLVYFDKSPLSERVDIYGIGQPVMEFPAQLRAAANKEETYLLVNENRFFVTNADLFTVVETYARPDGAPSLMLIKLLPQKENK